MQWRGGLGRALPAAGIVSAVALLVLAAKASVVVPSSSTALLGRRVLLHHSQLARAQHHDGRSHLGLSQKLCGCDPCTDVLQAPDIKMPEMPTLPDIKLPCPPDVSLPEAPCLPCTVVVSRPAAGENAAISRSHAHVLKFSQARELFNSSLKKFKSLQAPAGLSRERIFMCRENEESEFIVLHANTDDLRSRMRAATERFAAFGESRWDANGNRIVLQRSRSVHRLKRECVVYWYSFSNPRTKCIVLTCAPHGARVCLLFSDP